MKNGPKFAVFFSKSPKKDLDLQETQVFVPLFDFYYPLALKKITFVKCNDFLKSNGCIPLKSNALKCSYITYAVKSNALKCNDVTYAIKSNALKCNGLNFSKKVTGLL